MTNIAVVCVQDNPIQRFGDWVKRNIGFDIGKFVTPTIYETSDERYCLVRNVVDCLGLSLHGWLNMNQEIIPPKALVDEINIRIARTAEFERAQDSQREKLYGLSCGTLSSTITIPTCSVSNYFVNATSNIVATGMGNGVIEYASNTQKIIEREFDMKFCLKLKIGRLIFNNPATVLMVGEKKYVSKCHEEDFNETKGFLMCFAKSCGYTHSRIKSILRRRGLKNNVSAELCLLYDIANKFGLEDEDIVEIVNNGERQKEKTKKGEN